MAGKAYAVTRSDAEWRRVLTPEQYDIMRSHGTEAPGNCALLLEKATRQVFLRRLWPVTVRIKREVRKRDRLAQLQ
jgi:hypothetical protein